MKKTILILLDALHQQGAETVAVRIATGLQRSDTFRPVVCATRKGGPLEARLERNRIPYLVLGRKRAVELHRFRPLQRFLAEEEVCLVHAHKIGSNFWASLLGGVSKIPVIAHVHGQAESARNTWVDRFVARSARKIIAVSEFERDRMTRREGIDPEKIAIIYNGVTSTDFVGDKDESLAGDLGLDLGAPLVGIVAALRPEKNHELFLRSAARVLRTRPDANFLVIGDGPRRPVLEEMARKLGIETRLRFLGAVGEIPRYLSILDVGVLTSKREGLPMALLELQAAGIPVVATHVGGIPEVITDGENGYLVDPGDERGLAHRIEELLERRDRSRAMGRSGQQRVEMQFSETLMIQRVEDLYSQVLGFDSGGGAQAG